jgi:hypothetical protein
MHWYAHKQGVAKGKLHKAAKPAFTVSPLSNKVVERVRFELTTRRLEVDNPQTTARNATHVCTGTATHVCTGTYEQKAQRMFFLLCHLSYRPTKKVGTGGDRTLDLKICITLELRLKPEQIVLKDVFMLYH